MRLSIWLLLWLIVPIALAQNGSENDLQSAEMAKARAALKAGHGNQINTLILGERVEYHSNDGEPLLVWEGQAWLGRDEHKVWVKTEGEYESDTKEIDDAELQVLYSRAISTFWDMQIGLGHNIKPTPSRSFAVVGFQGLAPYWFEIDAALFLNEEGVLSSRLEMEYEIRITQRLILQPRIELNAAFSDDKEVGIGSGLSTSDVGLRLRYEFVREFAPYFGVAWSSTFGETEDLRRTENENTTQLSFVAGVRFWF